MGAALCVAEQELENDSGFGLRAGSTAQRRLLDPEDRPRGGSPKKLLGETILPNLICVAVPSDRVYSAMRCLGYALRRLLVVSSYSTS
jgi:hypothetical protein